MFARHLRQGQLSHRVGAARQAWTCIHFSWKVTYRLFLDKSLGGLLMEAGLGFLICTMGLIMPPPGVFMKD